MRRNFAQVLKVGKVDLKKEYSKLYNLFYEKDDRDERSLAELISMNFECFHFRGTCLDLEEFDEMNGFNFEKEPKDFDLDYLVSFCEYIYNFVMYFEDRFFFESISKYFYFEQIQRVVDAIGYMQASEDSFTIFVPKDNAAISVSESKLIPEKTSYKIISYNHHSMSGDIEGKKQTLIMLADLLEPRRKELESADRQLATDLFYAFNNFNIRHNNIDPAGKKYKKAVAELPKDDLEKWYDNTYQMCLLAFMQIENIERRNEFNALKDTIETK